MIPISTKQPSVSAAKLRNDNRDSVVYKLRKDLLRHYQLYFLVAIPVIYVFIFSYVPMYGAQIAFRNYRAIDGIWGSEWVGLDHFMQFFRSYQFKKLLRNTLEVSIYSTIAGFPFPILLAVALNNCTHKRFGKAVQMVTYAPHFISTVVLVGMVQQFLAPRYGIVNQLLVSMGLEEIMFVAKPELFSSIYVWSGIWQGTGWGSIVYLSALSAVDQSLHEAAIIDGASKLQRNIHIDIPCITPTIVILLIMDLGKMLNVGFDKALLLQNDMNLERSEVISTYVYKVGMVCGLPNYSYSTAIGLLNSVVNFIMITLVNRISRAISDISLW